MATAKYRIEHHNLDGTGPKPVRVYPVEPRTAPVYAPDLVRVVAEAPDYWRAVTDIPCPVCATGTIRWAEAGYVPGYRICDACGRHWLAGGDGEHPVLMHMGSWRSSRRGV